MATTTGIELRGKFRRFEERHRRADDPTWSTFIALLAENLDQLGVRTVRELDDALRIDAPEDDQLGACHLAGYLGDRRTTVRRLVHLLAETESDGVRCESARALMILGGATVYGRTVPLAVEHPSREVRKWATYVLAMGVDFDQDAAADQLLSIFLRSDEDPLIRAQAAEGIGNHVSRRRRQKYVKHLVAGLSDASPDVRLWACFALSGLGREAEIAALEALLGDRTVPEGWKWSVGREARWAIEGIRAYLGVGPPAEWPEAGELA